MEQRREVLKSRAESIGAPERSAAEGKLLAKNSISSNQILLDLLP